MAKIISERRAVELIRERGRCLARMNTVRGPKWFLIPGGEVSDETAARIRDMPQVALEGRTLSWPRSDVALRLSHADGGDVMTNAHRGAAASGTRWQDDTKRKPGSPATPETAKQRLFALTLRAGPGVDAIHSLRAVLKLALRRYHLRCTSLTEVRDD